MNTKSLIALVSILVLCSRPAAPAPKNPDIALSSLPSRVRLQFDPIPVSHNESMGVLGFHYDLFSCSCRSAYYFGMGGFGGLSGERGGFFIGGFSAGYQVSHGAWILESNIFAGGGGGASAFPGGGTMLRVGADLVRQFPGLNLRLGLARTDFPNTTSTFGSDTHISFGLDLPGAFQLASAYPGRPGRRPADRDKYYVRREEIIPVVAIYRPTRSSRSRRGQPLDTTIPLLGIQFHRSLGSHSFIAFEGYGAGGAGSDGYAKVLAGVGIEKRIDGGVVGWHARLLGGMAGGGAIDTGGGLILQPVVGVDFLLHGNWSLRPSVGWTTAPDGTFSATNLEIGISRSTRVPKLRPDAGAAILPAGRFGLQPRELSIRNKIYLPVSSVRLKSGQRQTSAVQQLGLVLSRSINRHLSLSGSAYGAWSGGVGAYAEGLFGLVLVPNRTGVFLRYDLGVGGGGGMDIGSGPIHQLLIGWCRDLNDRTAFSLEIGRMRNLRGGSFEATVVQLGYTWKLPGVFEK